MQSLTIALKELFKLIKAEGVTDTIRGALLLQSYIKMNLKQVWSLLKLGSIAKAG